MVAVSQGHDSLGIFEGFQTNVTLEVGVLIFLKLLSHLGRFHLVLFEQLLDQFVCLRIEKSIIRVHFCLHLVRMARLLNLLFF